MITTILVVCVFWFVLRRRKRMKSSTFETLEGDLPELIDQLIVLLRAGYTPANAFLQLEPWLNTPMKEVVAEVNVLVHRGVRFTTAVVEMRHQIGPPVYTLVDALIQLDCDGIATTMILDRLSSEAHAQRHRRAESEARELPVRLIFPIACCVFPSFILLTIAPMMVGALAGVGTHLG